MEILNTLDGIEVEIMENESSSICSILGGHQEVQELDKKYFECKHDELEPVKKGIIKYLKDYICEYIYSVNGNDRGKRAWHYVLIDPAKKEAFLEQVKAGSVDPEDYGKIFYSGWDENPPQNIKDNITKFCDGKRSGSSSKSLDNDLFIIKEEHEDKNAYHYILIDPDKREMFQQRSKTGTVLIREIEDYGRILYSGWGQDSPESISDRIARVCLCMIMGGRDLKGEFANLHIKDDNALHDAARNGELETIRCIIRKGVIETIRCIIWPWGDNVNSTDKNGWTSLHHAAYGGSLEVAQYLIDNGANLHGKDSICSRKPVHIAAREGHIDIIKLFLSRGAKVSDADKNSWMPLHYAVWNGQVGTAKLLINERADIHAKDATRGKKPIHIAAEKGHIGIIELFVSSGISIEDADKKGRTPLYYAAWNGDSEAVKFLADKGANIHAENTYSIKPIHAAAIEGHQRVIEFLLNNGASVHDTNKDGQTPLHFAARNGYLDIVMFLVDKVANINARDNNDKTPLCYARENGHEEIAGILDDLETERKNLVYTSLHDAAKDSDLEAVKCFISKDAIVSDLSKHGLTPLHIAAANGHKDIVEFFLNKGMDVDYPGWNGWTPLHVAAGKGNLGIIQFLLDKKANVHAEDTYGYIAMHVAALFGHKNVVEFFLSKGLDVNIPGQNNCTLLHLAAEVGYLEVVQFLLDKKANAYAKNTSGGMALHIAARNGHKNIVEFFFNKGLGIIDPDLYGCTPLHYAAEKGHLGVIQFLLDKVANINARDNNGKTPLDYARKEGHMDIVDILDDLETERGTPTYTSLHEAAK